jgi:hypothetical protein
MGERFVKFELGDRGEDTCSIIANQISCFQVVLVVVVQVCVSGSCNEVLADSMAFRFPR